MGKKATKKKTKDLNMPKKEQVNLRNLPRRRAAHYMEAYSNHCEVSRTPNDFSLRFSRLSTSVEKGKTTHELEEQCTVCLAFPQAKALQELLKRLVDEHEAEMAKAAAERK